MSAEDKMSVEDKKNFIKKIKKELCSGKTFLSIDEKYFNGNGVIQFIDRNFKEFEDIKFKKR